MDNALLMSMNNVLRQQKTLCDILADLSCHVIALHAVYRGIFVRIFLLYLLIIALQETQDLIIRRVRFTYQSSGITIGNILSR